MAVKIRLKRMGKKKQPTYRVVVADSRSPRDGRIIESIGRYDPRQEPSLVEIDGERALYWLRTGAQPTDRAQKLLEISGAWAQYKISKGEVYTVPTTVPGTQAPAEKPPAEEPAAEAETPAEEAPVEEPAAEAEQAADAAETPAEEAPPAEAEQAADAAETPAEEAPPAEAEQAADDAASEEAAAGAEGDDEAGQA
jgi:small subunit ribosomal protein S16